MSHCRHDELKDRSKHHDINKRTALFPLIAVRVLDRTILFTLLEVLLKLVLLYEIEYDRSVCQQSLMKILLCIGLLLLESPDLLLLAQ